MKVLLLGENSSVHSNLKDGLIELGHEVDVASDGDGWKNIPRDIDLDYRNKLIPSKLANRIYPWINIKNITGYDVVQIISPDCIFRKYFPSKLFFKIIRKFNSKVFMLGAGSDAFFWKYGRKRLKYGSFDDTLKYDLKTKKHPSESKSYIELNEYMSESVDGIIPVMYEYELSYHGHKNLLKTIPIPINTKKIKYEENIVTNKIVIFHGLNRYGFKGTRHVEEAFRILKNKYPNELELIIDGRMPLNKYLNMIKKTNIIIDQTNFHSLGLSGLYSMAMGKVTLGGAEPESLKSLGINSSPCINIKPNGKSIVEAIETIIDQKEKIKEIGFKSRKFIEEVHGHIRIAKQYLEAWN